MSRTVSLSLREALNAEQTEEIAVVLLTITHESLDDPIRVSSDPTTRLGVDPLRYGTISRGETFAFLPMQYIAPEDSDETPPAIRITLENIGRELVPLLRSTATPASVTAEIVKASDPDTVEVTWPEFDLVSAEYNADSVIIDLTVDALAHEPFPAGAFNPAYFPGLF